MSVPASAPAVRPASSRPPAGGGVRPRSALILLGLAWLGVLSLLTSELPLAPLAEQVGVPLDRLRWLVLLQPAVLVLIAVVVGWRTSRRTGLRLPVLDRGLAALSAAGLRRAGLVALIGGATLLLYGYLTSVVVPLEGAEALSMSLLTRLLYGGVTEEVLLRWGLLSLFAWAGLRLVRGADGRRSTILIAANVLAAVLFAVGHFPALAAISGALPVHFVASFLANTLVGLLFGMLFVRHGLEYAIVAHAGTHLVAVAAAAVVAPLVI